MVRISNSCHVEQQKQLGFSAITREKGQKCSLVLMGEAASVGREILMLEEFTGLD